MRAYLQLKTQAKQILNKSWRKCALLMLMPYLLLIIPLFLIFMATLMMLSLYLPIAFKIIELILIIAVLLNLWIMAGIKYHFLDWYGFSHHLPYGKFYCQKHVFKNTLQVFKKPYFDGTWAILAVKLIMTLLWGLLLIVPGIIKWISYSQALFIYKEHLNRHEHVSAMECLRESESMMKGHKWQYVLLMLSFIGWDILGMITLGIAFLWVIPYEIMTRVAFYEKITGKLATTDDTTVAAQLKVEEEFSHEEN